MTSLTGLSQSEAQEKLKQHGYNELPRESTRTSLKVFLDILKEPTLLLLVVAASIYLFIGDFSDAVFLLVLVTVMLSISFYQEFKAEKTLRSLRDLSSPRAFVIRGGQEIRIPSRELVPGDLVILHEGDRIPADAELIESKFLKTDESTLTGESISILKSPSKDNKLFLGSLVVGGQGLARVLETGPATQLGKIGLSLRDIEDDKTALQMKMIKVVKKLSVLASFLSILIVVAYGINYQDWLQGILSGIAAAMSLLPVEYPLVLALFLSMGAWRISRNQVLARRLPALEVLGSITSLCVDKTGTLTENRMTLRSLDNNGEVYDLRSGGPLPERFHTLVEYAALASHVDPYDPMDKAIWSTLTSLREPEHVHRDWTLVREYPLSDQLRAMSCVWKSPKHSDFIIAAKGAPETIIDLCHLSASERDLQFSRVQKFAAQGQRILAVAHAQFSESALPPLQHDFAFQWLGLVAMEDPIRPEAQAAVRECHEAGIQVSMITGDYPETARQIAQQIGLNHSEKVMTGEELQLLDPKKISKEIQKTSVFARILPQQKLDIVQAHQEAGHIVAMTGDGVNDAPALRKADVGVAMGARGTDVAREASDLVLLDDNFASIVKAIRSGRRIYENLRKAFLYLLCIHFPIAGLTIVPVLLKMPLLLFPAHIVMLEMIIDPTCTLAFEAENENSNIMKRPPRGHSEPLMSFNEIVRSLLIGILGLVATFSVYWFSLNSQTPVDKARTMAFATLIFWNLGAILVHRGSRSNWKSAFSVQNKILNSVVIITLTFLFVTLNVPTVAGLFHFSPLSGMEWLSCFAAGSSTILISSLLQIRFPDRNKRKSQKILSACP